MHRILCGCAVVAAVAFGTPALGAVGPGLPAFGDASGTPATAPARGNDPNEVICKASANQTGSGLLRRRVCMTRTEWQQMEVANREQINDLQNRSLSVAPHQ